ncbi:hypothetical protein [Gloeomargarita lithophora]|uniref:hypothetical protein n=1 Tax=Gloeomargarita lithophora TaxID=1188228 RepID=UPI0012FD7BFE|nr:hypothetical protein [Gloeomargarita lithophora]
MPETLTGSGLFFVISVFTLQNGFLLVYVQKNGAKKVLSFLIGLRTWSGRL